MSLDQNRRLECAIVELEDPFALLQIDGSLALMHGTDHVLAVPPLLIPDIPLHRLMIMHAHALAQLNNSIFIICYQNIFIGIASLLLLYWTVCSALILFGTVIALLIQFLFVFLSLSAYLCVHTKARIHAYNYLPIFIEIIYLQLIRYYRITSS